MEYPNLYLGKIPTKVVNTMIVVIIVFFIVIVVGGLLIRQPDTVKGKFNVYSDNMPYSLIAKIEGEVSFLQKDKVMVKGGTDIAYIITSSDYKQVTGLERVVNSKNISTIKSQLFTHSYSKLGDVSTSYLELMQALRNLGDTQRSNLYPLNKRQSNISKNSYEESLKAEMKMLGIEQRELETDYQEFINDSALFVKNVITRMDYLQSRQNYWKQREAVTNLNNEIAKLESNVADEGENHDKIDAQYTEDINKGDQDVIYYIGVVRAAIKEWRNRYVLTAPTKGKLEYANFTESSHAVKEGAEVARVLPTNNDLRGIIYFPSINSGNVKVGSKAKLYFDNYDKISYGYVDATISDLSSSLTTSSDGNTFYTGELKIDFTHQKNFKGDFKFSHGMSGTADIIVKDKNLMDKIINWFDLLIH